MLFKFKNDTRTINWKNIIKNILKWTLVLSILFLTDTLFFATNINRIYNTISTYLIFTVSICLFSYVLLKNKKISKFVLFSLMGIFYYIIFIFYRIDGIQNSTFFIFQGSLLIFGISFSYIIGLKEFANKYVKIIRFIAIFSLITYFLGDVIISNLSLPKIINTLNISFDSAIFSNIPHYSQARNWGPFREPGVYQAFLNISLIFSLFVVKENKFINSLIFTITSLTTLSGAALLPIILIVAAYLITSNNDDDFVNSKLKYTLAFTITCVLFFSVYYGKVDDILLKLTNQSGSQSILLRSSSLITSFKSFYRSPVFGSSLEIQRKIALEISSKYVGSFYEGTVNTFPAFFSSYGFHIGTIYLLGTWKFLKEFSKGKTTFFLFFAIILTTSNENLTTSLLISVIPFLRNERRIESKSENHYSEI